MSVSRKKLFAESACRHSKAKSKSKEGECGCDKASEVPKYQTCGNLISYLPANIKVVIQEDPLIAALIADVRQAGCLALEHVSKQRLKATKSGALVMPCAGGKLVLLQLHRLC